MTSAHPRQVRAIRRSARLGPPIRLPVIAYRTGRCTPTDDLICRIARITCPHAYALKRISIRSLMDRRGFAENQRRGPSGKQDRRIFASLSPVASAPLERRSSCYDSSTTGCDPPFTGFGMETERVARSRDLLRRPDIGCCACSPRTREPSEPRMIAIRRCLRCAAAGVHRGAGDRRQVGGRDWPCCGTGMRGNSLGLAG